MAANHLRKPIAEVVAEKRTTRQRVHYAIRDGHLNSEWFGAMRVIVADKTYYAWRGDQDGHYQKNQQGEDRWMMKTKIEYRNHLKKLRI